MIYTSPFTRWSYILASVVVGTIVLFAMDRVHQAQGAVGQRQAPRALHLAMLSSLFTVAMNLIIYALIPTWISLGDGTFRMMRASCTLRNFSGEFACALYAVSVVQLWGGFRRRQFARRVRQPQAQTVLDDTAVALEIKNRREQRPPVRH